MQSVHAMREFLEAQRRSFARSLGDRPLGSAADEVLERLIARVHELADQRPADAPITLGFVQVGMVEALALIRQVVDTLGRMIEMITEAHDNLTVRRQPFIALLNRIESQGYVVDLATYTDVTDGRDWSALDAVEDPDRRVALAAEQIARAEQASIYQQQLKRMDAAINEVEAEYADHIRTISLAD